MYALKDTRRHQNHSRLVINPNSSHLSLCPRDCFSNQLILLAALWPLSPNRNWFQDSSTGKVRPAFQTDILTDIPKRAVQKTWDPRRSTNLWSFKACYIFTSFKCNVFQGTFQRIDAKSIEIHLVPGVRSGSTYKFWLRNLPFTLNQPFHTLKNCMV